MANTKYRPIIVTSVKEDVHIPYVQRHLSEPMLLVDTRVDPKSKLNFVLNRGHLVMVYDNKEIRNPRGIWYRKPLPVDRDQLPVEKHQLDYSESALQMHLTALYSLFPNALWVSDYYAIKRANSKPSQLTIAAKLGFQVPSTLFTNDSNAAKAFIKKQKQCVIKPLAIRDLFSKDGMIMNFFTRQINTSEKIDFSGLYLAPAIFQQEITAARELRVTVVGTKVFAAAITTKGVNKTPIRDYKLAYVEPKAKVIIEPYKLPNDISEKCIAHAKAFNLEFCAIDLLEDKQGKIWFLENNPNGQWAFVEKEIGHQIGKAIAELLMSKK